MPPPTPKKRTTITDADLAEILSEAGALAQEQLEVPEAKVRAERPEIGLTLSRPEDLERHEGPRRAFPAPSGDSERLAVENRALAMRFANGFATKMQLPVSELESVAWMSLLKAARVYSVEKINPKNGQPYAFSTLASKYIKGGLLQYARDRTLGMRFPQRWREAGPRVIRMAQEGKNAQEVADEVTRGGVPISAGEVRELVGAMRKTVSSDEIGEPSTPRGPAEIVHGFDEDERGRALFHTAGIIARLAFDGIHPADQQALSRFFSSSRRGKLPSLALGQFLRKAAQLGGKALENFDVERTELGFDLPSFATEDQPRLKLKRRRSPVSTPVPSRLGNDEPEEAPGGQ